MEFIAWLLKSIKKKPRPEYFEELLFTLKSQGEDNPKQMTAIIGRSLLTLINEYFEKMLMTYDEHRLP